MSILKGLGTKRSTKRLSPNPRAIEIIKNFLNFLILYVAQKPTNGKTANNICQPTDTVLFIFNMVSEKKNI
jgi:hypothetical protein